jgi:hypothetical protein
VKERVNVNDGKFDSLKAIVNNSDKYGNKKYKNNKPFKQKKEGNFYPKNNYGKKQFVNTQKEGDNFSTNINNQFSNNTQKTIKSYNTNNYNTSSNFSSKPMFMNPNANQIDNSTPISNLISKEGVTNLPPNFVNPTLPITTGPTDPANILSSLEQIGTLDLSNLNLNISNANPNYQKGNNPSSSSTFQKKKYDFSSDDKSFRREFGQNQNTTTTIMRKFDNKPTYPLK